MIEKFKDLITQDKYIFLFKHTLEINVNIKEINFMITWEKQIHNTWEWKGKYFGQGLSG